MKIINLDKRGLDTDGIYVFINNINNKIYVGSSNNRYKRIYEHIRTLNKGSHHNCHLQRAWNKYG